MLDESLGAVPDITPVLEFRLIPLGNAPETTEYVTAESELAVTVTVYELPAIAPVKAPAEVLHVGAAETNTPCGNIADLPSLFTTNTL